MKSKTFKFYLGSVLLVFTCSSFAQLQNAAGTWLSLFKTGQFGNDEKNSYELYIQDRAYAQDNTQNLINLGAQVRREIAPQQFLGLGYQWYHSLDSRIFGQDDENRIIESYHIILPLIDKSMTWRSQLEERKANDNSTWNFVLREKLELNKPFANYEWINSDEIFINLNTPDWVPQRTFYENRASTGVSIKLKGDKKLFLGYLNRYLLNDPNNQMQHILTCTLIFN